MDNDLNTNYTQVTVNEAKPLITVVRFQNLESKNPYDVHYSIYYGKDNSGTIYVGHKPGRDLEPYVNPLLDNNTSWHGYQITGYYNLKQ